MTERLKFGILGAGVIGPVHAAALAALPDAELVAVADVDAERARALAARYGATAYPDLAALLAGAPVDVVTICTPSGLHAAQAAQAMRASRHVLVEKPLALRRADLDALLRVQQETGVKLAVVSQHRFDPASRAVHARIAEGALGRLVLGSVQVPWWRSQGYYDSGTWRGTAALDGGVLLNQGIHSIDLLLWLLGPVRGVAAYAGTLTHRMETEDAAVAVLRFANGALGTIAATTAAYPGGTTRIEVYGDRGSALIENDALAGLHLARDEAAPAGDYGRSPGQAPRPAATGVDHDPAAVPVSTHALQIADLIRAIREDGTPLVDGQEGRRPVDLILAMYESARSGREVALP